MDEQLTRKKPVPIDLRQEWDDTIAWLRQADPRQTASFAIMVGANLVPLWGVLFEGWTPFSVMFLYWLENIVIGLFNVFAMMFAKGTPAKAKTSTTSNLAPKTGLVPFFIVHYGIFTTVHGIFVFSLFGSGGALLGTDGSETAEPLLSTPLLLAIAVIFFSHLYSFLFNYIGSGAYKNVTAEKLFLRPYARVIVLHITIIFGGMFVMTIGGGMAIALLVFLKLAFDTYAHRKDAKFYSSSFDTLLTPGDSDSQ